MEDYNLPFVLMLTFEVTFWLHFAFIKKHFTVFSPALISEADSGLTAPSLPLLFSTVLPRSAPLQHRFTKIRSSSTSLSQIYCSSTVFPDPFLFGIFPRSTPHRFLPFPSTILFPDPLFLSTAVPPDNTIFHFDSFGSCLHFLLDGSSILRPTEHTDHGRRFLAILMWL